MEFSQCEKVPQMTNSKFNDTHIAQGLNRVEVAWMPMPLSVAVQ